MNWFDWSLIGILVLTVAIAGYLILEVTVLFPHKFVVKEKTNRGCRVIITRAKEITSKDGVPKWRLLYKRKEVPVPPEAALNMTKRGKYIVTGWLFQDGQVQYETTPTVDAVQVATTNQRIQLAYQFQRAEKERMRGWKDLIGQVAVPLGFGILIAVIVIVGMVQWTELNKPGLQYQENQLELQKLVNANAVILQNIAEGVQVLTVRTESEKVKNNITNKPPN